MGDVVALPEMWWLNGRCGGSTGDAVAQFGDVVAQFEDMLAQLDGASDSSDGGPGFDSCEKYRPAPPAT